MSTVKGDTLYPSPSIDISDDVYVTKKGADSVVLTIDHDYLDKLSVVMKDESYSAGHLETFYGLKDKNGKVWTAINKDFEEGMLSTYQGLSPTDKMELWRRQGIDMRDDSSVANTAISFDEECECHIKSWSQAEVNKQKMIEEGMEDVKVEDKPYNPLDVQHGGGHYKDRAIQPIEYIMSNGLNFCEGNVIKYVTRHRSKNGREDLEKAKHYVEFLIYQWDKENGKS